MSNFSSNENEPKETNLNQAELNQNCERNHGYLNQFYHSQYSSMSGTDYTSELFLDEELLNNYQQERV